MFQTTFERLKRVDAQSETLLHQSIPLTLPQIESFREKELPSFDSFATFSERASLVNLRKHEKDRKTSEEALAAQVVQKSKEQQQQPIAPPPPPPSAPIFPVSNTKTALKIPQPQPEQPVPDLRSELAEAASFQSQVDQFEKHHARTFSKIYLFITQLTNTRADVLQKVRAPQDLLRNIAQRGTEMDTKLAVQCIANHIVLVAATSLTVEKVTRGEHNFGLVYLTLLLCEGFKTFASSIVLALKRSCPFVSPVFVRNLMAQSELRTRENLGYLSETETDDMYLLRMQSLVGFYAALLQTDGVMLFRENRLEKAVSVEVSSHEYSNPFGGLQHAWQWVSQLLNSPLWRWTRFLVQSFLTVCGHELSRLPQSTTQFMAKLFRLLQTEVEILPVTPADADRNTAFKTFVKQSLADLTSSTLHFMRSPGIFTDDKVWVDCRLLIEDTIKNEATS